MIYKGLQCIYTTVAKPGRDTNKIHVLFGCNIYDIVFRIYLISILYVIGK